MPLTQVSLSEKVNNKVVRLMKVWGMSKYETLQRIIEEYTDGVK